MEGRRKGGKEGGREGGKGDCVANLRSLEEKNDPSKFDRVFLGLVSSAANELREDATGVFRTLSDSPRNLIQRF